jgi:hypothetical protein
MNARRVAILHRELARVHADLADAFEAAEDPDGEAPADEPSAPQPKRLVQRAAPRLVRPEGENDELSRRKAQTFLRRNGYTKTSP